MCSNFSYVCVYIYVCVSCTTRRSLAPHSSSLCLVSDGLPVFFQITTLERQFGLTSAQSGQIFAANEIGYLTLTLPASHFAARWHVPRALFISAVVLGVSGAMCGLPHFLFPESELGPNISTIHSAGTLRFSHLEKSLHPPHINTRTPL